MIALALFVIPLGVLVLSSGDGDSLATRVTDRLWVSVGGDPAGGQVVPSLAPQTPLADRSVPSGILDLTNWKLAIPAAQNGSEDASEISEPKLSTYQDPRWFHVDPAQQGVVFRAGVGGATTSGSDYPRSELREMFGKKEADWSSKSGTHVMTIDQAITATPIKKPDVVAGQIHDDDDDVLTIRLEGRKLFVASNDSNDPVGVLDPNYVLGTRFTVQVKADPTGIHVTYNGTKTVDYHKTGKHYYFKAGCYTQSNRDQDKPKDAYGEVVIYALTVQHTA